MKYHSNVLLGANIFFFLLCSVLFRCGFDIENPTPPSQPRWIGKSLVEDWPELGIDADESGGIFLEWEQNPEDDILAYMLYRAINDRVTERIGEFELIQQLIVGNNHSLEYTDIEVEKGISYSYKFIAVDHSGNSSVFSEIVTYTLLEEVKSAEMAPNDTTEPLDENNTLRWFYLAWYEMEYFVITLLTAENELVTRQKIIPSNLVDGNQLWIIPGEYSLTSGQIYKWRVDISARYVNGIETAGSESAWAVFIYH